MSTSLDLLFHYGSQAARSEQDIPLARHAALDYVRQLRRRRFAAYRCPPLPDGLRDPWTDRHTDEWTDSELDSLAATAAHLRSIGLYGAWQVPESARRVWRCRSCPCHREAA